MEGRDFVLAHAVHHEPQQEEEQDEEGKQVKSHGAAKEVEVVDEKESQRGPWEEENGGRRADVDHRVVLPEHEDGKEPKLALPRLGLVVEPQTASKLRRFIKRVVDDDACHVPDEKRHAALPLRLVHFQRHSYPRVRKADESHRDDSVSQVLHEPEHGKEEHHSRGNEHTHEEGRDCGEKEEEEEALDKDANLEAQPLGRCRVRAHVPFVPKIVVSLAINHHARLFESGDYAVHHHDFDATQRDERLEKGRAQTVRPVHCSVDELKIVRLSQVTRQLQNAHVEGKLKVVHLVVKGIEETRVVGARRVERPERQR